jgi:hypothetical protein
VNFPYEFASYLHFLIQTFFATVRGNACEDKTFNNGNFPYMWHFYRSILYLKYTFIHFQLAGSELGSSGWRNADTEEKGQEN